LAGHPHFYALSQPRQGPERVWLGHRTDLSGWADHPIVTGPNHHIDELRIFTGRTRAPYFHVPGGAGARSSASRTRSPNWLQSHLDGYAQWSKTHSSLLIVTFDEDNSLPLNHIYTAHRKAVAFIGYGLSAVMKLALPAAFARLPGTLSW
jgi:hypothetical protein